MPATALSSARGGRLWWFCVIFTGLRPFGCEMALSSDTTGVVGTNGRLASTVRHTLPCNDFVE